MQRLGCAVLFGAGAFICCMLCHADGSAPDHPPFPAASGAFDASSTTLLCGVSDYVANLKHLTFEARVHTKRSACGVMDETAEYQFLFERPNHFSMRMKLPDESLMVKGDGQKLLLALDSAREYVLQDQPGDLGAVVGWVTQQPAFRRLFSQRLTAGWTENVHHASCAKDNIGGQPCNRLQTAFDLADVSIWFRDGDAPAPVRLCADLSRTLAQPAGSLTTEIAWSNWQTDKPAPPDSFTPSPPKGYKEVKSFTDTERNDTDHELAGRQAPPFLLQLLDKNAMSLHDHIGKHVVILDFWSTFCHPCRSALRDLEAIAPHIAKERAIIYAVNLGDPPGKVAEFVSRMSIGLPVALDPDGTLAEQLHIQALPTAIIIGLDGIIQAVHVGYDKGLIPEIRGYIDAIAQGKSLTGNARPISSGSQLRHRLELDSNAYCAVFVGY